MSARLLLAASIGATILVAAGCVAAALAEDPYDQLYLRDGTVVRGEVQSCEGGKYTILALDGIEYKYAFADIDSVVMADEGGVAKTLPVVPLPHHQEPRLRRLDELVDEDEYTPVYEEPDDFRGGVEIYYLGAGGRFSWERPGRVLNSFDLRFGAVHGFIYGYYPGAVVGFGAAAFDFFDAPWQLEATAGLTLQMTWWSVYPGVIVGVAAQHHFGERVQANLGAMFATDMYLSYPVLVPDVSIAFLW